MMYLLIKVLIVVLCIVGVSYLIFMNLKYKNDTSTSKDDIVNYFKEHQAVSIESGIKIKDLPTHIAKNPYLLMMVKDKTLTFKKGKYYLSSNR